VVLAGAAGKLASHVLHAASWPETYSTALLDIGAALQHDAELESLLLSSSVILAKPDFTDAPSGWRLATLLCICAVLNTRLPQGLLAAHIQRGQLHQLLLLGRDREASAGASTATFTAAGSAAALFSSARSRLRDAAITVFTITCEAYDGFMISDSRTEMLRAHPMWQLGQTAGV
jgi:hypothetical protein